MTNLTASDEFTELIPTPDPAEPVRSGGVIGAILGAVRPAFQVLFNRGAALHGVDLYTSLVPRVLLASNGGAALSLTIPGRAALINAAGKRYLSAGWIDQQITVAAMRPAATKWPASSLLYIYAIAGTVPEGQMQFEVYTTPPDGGRLFKSDAAPTHRYVGCFLTDASATPVAIPLSGDRGVYRYVAPRIAGGGTSATYANVLLTGLLPPHARRILAYAVATGDTSVGGSQSIYLRPGGSSDEVVVASAPRSVAGIATAIGYADLPLFDGTLEYKVTGSSASSAAVGVGGWTE